LSKDKINEQFIDIINQEDWNETPFEEEVETIINLSPIVRPQEALGDVPLGSYIIPTPIPNVYISVALGFEIDNGDDYGSQI
jgi:hypothetical protein